MPKFLPLLLTASCFFLNFKLNAQQGSLDVTFGKGGKVTSRISSQANYGTCTAIQTDGKIIVGGYSWQNGYEFTLIRYLTNGSIDSTFGTNGVAINTYPNYQSYGYSLKIQSDGKILLAGNSDNGFGKNSFALARFTSNGYPDYSFGIAGFINTSYPNNNYVSNAYAVTLTIQNDGKYLLGGNLSHSSSRTFTLLRYKASGVVDSSFGSDGWVVTKYNTQYDTLDYGTTVLVQPDNKIVLAGYAEVDFPNIYTYEFAISKYDSAGQPDSSFGINGQVLTNFNGINAYAYSALIQPDNKILLAGAIINYSNNTSNFALARYKPDGTPDSTFGTNGVETTPLDSSTSSIANGILLQPNGKILVAGKAGGNFALVRYNTNGTFDPSFGIHGQVYTDFGTDYDEANAIALQTDGKIVLAGDDEGTHLEVARYNITDGVLPVNLVSISVVKQNETAIIKWITSDNVINNSFIVQRSTDGINFKDIGKVSGSTNTTYSFQDDLSALVYKPAVIFYRLLIIDGAGIFIYSGIKTLAFNTNQHISLFPNPARSSVNLIITTSQNEKAKMQIISIDGRIVSHADLNILKGSSIYNIDVSSVNSGTYLIKIATSEYLNEIKFIKE